MTGVVFHILYRSAGFIIVFGRCVKVVIRMVVLRREMVRHRACTFLAHGNDALQFSIYFGPKKGGLDSKNRR